VGDDVEVASVITGSEDVESIKVDDNDDDDDDETSNIVGDDGSTVPSRDDDEDARESVIDDERSVDKVVAVVAGLPVGEATVPVVVVNFAVVAVVNFVVVVVIFVVVVGVGAAPPAVIVSDTPPSLFMPVGDSHATGAALANRTTQTHRISNTNHSR
jgi:hypothetical protein